jgi:hypothetical protein
VALIDVWVPFYYQHRTGKRKKEERSRRKRKKTYRKSGYVFNEIRGLVDILRNILKVNPINRKILPRKIPEIEGVNLRDPAVRRIWKTWSGKGVIMVVGSSCLFRCSTYSGGVTRRRESAWRW